MIKLVRKTQILYNATNIVIRYSQNVQKIKKVQKKFDMY